MKTIIELVVGPLGAIIGSLIAIAGAWFVGRRSGKVAEQNKRLRARLEAREAKDEIEDAVAGRTPEQNREELGRWSRS